MVIRWDNKLHPPSPVCLHSQGDNCHTTTVIPLGGPLPAVCNDAIGDRYWVDSDCRRIADILHFSPSNAFFYHTQCFTFPLCNFLGPSFLFLASDASPFASNPRRGRLSDYQLRHVSAVLKILREKCIPFFACGVTKQTRTSHALLLGTGINVRFPNVFLFAETYWSRPCGRRMCLCVCMCVCMFVCLLKSHHRLASVSLRPKQTYIRDCPLLFYGRMRRRSTLLPCSPEL